MSDEKKQAMQLAIQSALTGIKNEEGGPFGACIVKDGEVIAVAHNTVLKDRDPTCHAEMNAIRMAAKELDEYNLAGCELYTNAEPCPMCLSAIYWARIDKIYIGVDKTIAAKYGFDDAKFYEQILTTPLEREVPQEFGTMPEECEKVFAHWKTLGGLVY